MSRTVDADTAFTQARKFIREGKSSEAIKLLTALKQQGYDKPKVLETLAVAHSMLGEYEMAVETLEAAIVKSPGRASSYVNLGAVYNRLGQYDLAIERLDQATRIDWRCVEAYYNLGISYRNLKDYSQAKAMFQEAIRLRPEMVDAWHNLAAVFLETSNAQLAASWFRKVLKQKPDHAKAKKGLRAAEAQLNQLDNPLAQIEAAPADNEESVLSVANTQPMKKLSHQDRVTIKSSGMEIEQETARLLEWFQTHGDALLHGLRRQLSIGIQRKKSSVDFCHELQAGMTAESSQAEKLDDAINRLSEFQDRYLRGAS